MGFNLVPLGPHTWEGFADLVERDTGIIGGCWCVGGKRARVVSRRHEPRA